MNKTYKNDIVHKNSFKNIDIIDIDDTDNYPSAEKHDFTQENNLHDIVIKTYGLQYYKKVWENVDVACSLEYAIDKYERNNLDIVNTRSIIITNEQNFLEDHDKSLYKEDDITNEQNIGVENHCNHNIDNTNFINITDLNSDNSIGKNKKHENRDCYQNMLTSNTQDIQNNEKINKTNVNDNTNEKMRITLLHQNVQSLSNKTDMIDELIHSYDINILCLTEHWLEYDYIDLVTFSDFKIVTKYCRNKNEHGGNVIYMKQHIIDMFEITEIDFNFANVKSVIECCGVKVNKKNKNELILIIICMYRTPYDANIDIFIEKFDEISRKLNILENRTIICGDLNIDHLTQTTTKYKKIKDIFDTYKIKNRIKEITRPVTKTGLDYVIVNNDMKYEQIGVINTNISDHSGQILKCELRTEITKNKMRTINKRYYNRQENDEMMEKLLNEMNNTMENDIDMNIDIKWEKFLNKIKEHHDTAYPLVEVKINPQIQRKKWINDEIRTNGRELREMKLSNVTEKHVINQKKRDHIKSIRAAKKKYYKEKIHISTNKPKSMWQYYFTSIGKIISKENIKIKVGDTEINDSKNLSENFRKYFVESVIEKIKNNVMAQNDSDNDNIIRQMNKYIANSMTLFPATTSELIKVINKLPNNNGSGYNDIPTKLIKQNHLFFANNLANMINESFQKGHYPTPLKQCLISPLHKKGDKTDISNYRPLYKMTNISKIYQKVLCDRINNFFEKHEILTSHQHGFRPNRSTNSACFELYKYIIEKIDQGYLVLSIFFDLTAAFDVVDIDILLKKFECMGIRGVANNLLETLLRERTLRVKIKDSISSEAKVNVGVPQGNNTANVAFLPFVNDLPQYVSDTEVGMFADDFVTTIIAKNDEEMQMKIENVISQVLAWCKNNKLILNVKKTNYLMYNNRSQNLLRTNISVSINNQIVECVKSFKYLGVNIDESLTGNNHVDTVCKKLSQLAFIVYRLKHIFDRKHLMTIYYAYGVSIISYGIMFWGKSPDHNRVFLLQKRIIRNIFNLEFTETCKNTYIENNILTYYGIYYYELIMYYKKNEYLYNSNINTHGYNTRTRRIILPKHRTQLYAKAPYYTGLKVYEKIPDSLKTMPMPIFKRNIKEWLASKCLYNFDAYFE